MKNTMEPKPALYRAARVALGILLIPAVLSLTACVVGVRPAGYVVAGPPPGEVVVNEAPPAAPAEVVTVAPAPGLVWVGGYWGWYGGRYTWVAGGWHRPPYAGAVWSGRYWARRPGGGHVFIRGGWR
jgi:hypothetical protein